MIPLRVLLVCDRFWPIVDFDALPLEQMSRALSRRGHLLRVLTRSWHKYWSPTLRIGDLDLVRLPYSARSRFGNARLVRHLSQWLESHREEFDLLVIDPLCEWSAPAVQFAARHEVPICLWQVSVANPATWSAAWTKLRRSVSAISPHAYWIVPEAARADQIRAAGGDPQRVIVLGPSIDCSPDAEVSRAVARSALADNHPTLLVDPSEPLVVSLGFWNAAPGVIELVDAWHWVRQAFPCSKLWLIGSGIEIHKIADHVRLRQLSNEVIMAGCFDDLNDVLRAADLLIQTDASVAPPFATLAAMRHGLPVLANTSGRSANDWLRDGENGFAYSPGEPQQLAHRVIDLLEQLAAREAVADSAYRIVLQQYDLEPMALRLEQLGRDLVEHREKVQSCRLDSYTCSPTLSHLDRANKQP